MTRNSGRIISCGRRRYKTVEAAVIQAGWMFDNTDATQLWIYSHEWAPLRTSPEGEKVSDCCARTPGKVVYHLTTHPMQVRSHGKPFIMALLKES